MHGRGVMADPTNLGATLSARLATSATGWGAVIGGILDVRTITDSRNGAALNAIYATGRRVLSTCHDTECDCMVRALASFAPDVKLVRVKVDVADD
jgi:hypothetical protein